MIRHTSRPVRSLRILVVTLALLLVSTLAASADPLVPAVDTGGAGGGGGSATILDEMARSQELIALSQGDAVAINGRGQVAFEETEYALAQNAEVQIGMHPNDQRIALLEGRTLVALAGGNELAEAPQAIAPNTTY